MTERYKIVEGTYREVVACVNTLMAAGWHPNGGITVAYRWLGGKEGWIYAQAMVLRTAVCKI